MLSCTMAETFLLRDRFKAKLAIRIESIMEPPIAEMGKAVFSPVPRKYSHPFPAEVC